MSGRNPLSLAETLGLTLTIPAPHLQDTLIACITDNPRPVLFPVSCSGAAPKAVVEGPWDDALSRERAALEELRANLQVIRVHADVAIGCVTSIIFKFSLVYRLTSLKIDSWKRSSARSFVFDFPGVISASVHCSL